MNYANNIPIIPQEIIEIYGLGPSAHINDSFIRGGEVRSLPPMGIPGQSVCFMGTCDKDGRLVEEGYLYVVVSARIHPGTTNLDKYYCSQKVHIQILAERDLNYIRDWALSEFERLKNKK